ncbi:hypothetical protein SPHINGOAX6_60068 [Sphingomonas sp. AX6]|nr:hypothetical protein SPHINGOAX6_60068 [Sphingomonas sp. AX6]
MLVATSLRSRRKIGMAEWDGQKKRAGSSPSRAPFLNGRLRLI